MNGETVISAEQAEQNCNFCLDEALGAGKERQTEYDSAGNGAEMREDYGT